MIMSIIGYMFRNEHLMKGFDSRKYVRYEIILC